jgi:hypothetical protein
MKDGFNNHFINCLGVHLAHELVIFEFPTSHDTNLWHLDIPWFFGYNHLTSKLGLHGCFRLLMGNPIINTCILPFIVSFAKLKLIHVIIFYNEDCVAFKLTSQKSIKKLVIANKLECFAKSMAKT